MVVVDSWRPSGSLQLIDVAAGLVKIVNYPGGGGLGCITQGWLDAAHVLVACAERRLPDYDWAPDAEVDLWRVDITVDITGDSHAEKLYPIDRDTADMHGSWVRDGV